MSQRIFVDDAAHARMKTWFETFRAALPIDSTSRVLETTYGLTHVLDAGPKDGPPIVLLHGALASSAHVLGEVAPLARTHRIYAVDVIGQSPMSEERRIDVRDDSYGRWLIEVCDALGLREVTLFGVSWGGFVAAQAARLAPERIAALVLVVPAGVVAGPAWSGFWKMGWPLLLYRLAPSDARLARVMAPLFTNADDERWRKFFADALLAHRLDMRIPPLADPSQFSGWNRPTLVFGASEDLSFPGAALVARAKALWPSCETELLAGVRHCPPTDDAFRSRLAARVSTFLDGAVDRARPAA